MSRYCLDTSAVSHFQRGEDPVVEIFDSAEWLGLPSVVVGELLSGYRLGRRPEENRDWLAELLAHPVVEELPVDRQVAVLYAELFYDLRRAGTPIPTNDLWIASTAVRHGATVLTYDEHFRAVRRVGTRLLGGD